jgi:hypothetical protein
MREAAGDRSGQEAGDRHVALLLALTLIKDQRGRGRRFAWRAMLGRVAIVFVMPSILQHVVK